MDEAAKTKFVKITKSISDKSYLLLIIPVLLRINRDFFGMAPFLSVYCILVVTFLAAIFSRSILTGEVECKGFYFKMDEKPFLYYLLMIMYNVIAVFFLFGLIDTLQN